MEVTTQIRLLWLGGLAVLFGLAWGTAWLLRAWPQRQEQRRARLLARVRQQVPAERRDQIALQVCGTRFGRRAVLLVDLGPQVPQAWWPLVTGLSRTVSPEVRRLVCRTEARPGRVTLTITLGRRRG